MPIKLKELLESMALASGEASTAYASDITSTDGEYVMSDSGKPYGTLLAKNINGQKDFAIYVSSNVDSYTNYALFDLKASPEDKLIGIIRTQEVSNTKAYSLFTTLGIKGSIRVVHWSIVAQDYKGRGFGAALYDAVWNHTDVFVSDSVLFEGSLAMWSKHILPHAAFFGGFIKNDRAAQFVLPLDRNQVKQIVRNDGLSDGIQGFLAIKDASNIPKELRKIIYNLKGVNSLTQVAVLRAKTSIKDKTFYTDVEEKDYTFDNFLTLIGNMSKLTSMVSNEMLGYVLHGNGAYKQTKKKVVIFIFDDATVLVREQNGELVPILI